MNRTPDIASQNAFDRTPKILRIEFLFKQYLSQKFEFTEQRVFVGFVKHEQIKKLCFMLKGRRYDKLNENNCWKCQNTLSTFGFPSPQTIDKKPKKQFFTNAK